MRISTGKHGFGQGRHERFGLDVQIAYHCVRAPMADHFDKEGINTVGEDRHGTAATEGAAFDGGWVDAKAWVMRGSQTENGSDVARFNVGKNWVVQL